MKMDKNTKIMGMLKDKIIQLMDKIMEIQLINKQWKLESVNLIFCSLHPVPGSCLLILQI